MLALDMNQEPSLNMQHEILPSQRQADAEPGFPPPPPPPPPPSYNLKKEQEIGNEQPQIVLPHPPDIPNGPEEDYAQILKEFTLNIIYLHSFAILFSSIFLFELDYKYTFALLFMWDATDLYLILRNRAKTLHMYTLLHPPRPLTNSLLFLIIFFSPILRRRYFFLIIEKYIVIILKVMILIYFMTRFFHLIFATLPLAFYCFIRCFTYKTDRNNGECNTMIDFV